MRGRVIHPFLAEISQLDTLATSKDPDASGTLTSGYDTDFREPVKLPPATAEGPGTTVQEVRVIRIPCQIEVLSYDKQHEFFSGNSPLGSMILVVHFTDLETLGYIDSATNEATLRVGDRLDAIYNKCGVLVQTLRIPLYCTQVQPAEFGLGGARNLLLLTFQTNDTAVQV